MFSAENDNDLVECPYDSTHRILRKRLQIHILRCRKYNPDVELRKCPFNAIHLIPEPEYLHHVATCTDRKIVTQYKYNEDEKPVEHEILQHEKIDDEENWDDIELNVPDFKQTKFLAKYVNRDKDDIIEEPVVIARPTRSRTRSRSPSRTSRSLRSRTRSPPRIIEEPVIIARSTVSRTRSPSRTRRSHIIDEPAVVARSTRSRTRSPSRTRRPQRSRSRSPVQRFSSIQPKREYFSPRRRYIEPQREYYMPYRERESPPRQPYTRYSNYTSNTNYSREYPSTSSHYRNFRNHTHIKKDLAKQNDVYELDEDPYYNGGL